MSQRNGTFYFGLVLCALLAPAGGCGEEDVVPGRCTRGVVAGGDLDVDGGVLRDRATIERRSLDRREIDQCRVMSKR